MSNHLHIVVLTDPHHVESWSPIEVATRWASAHPRTGPDGNPQAWSPAEIAEIAEKAEDPVWIDIIRKRLRLLSWFMKNIKEGLARRANRDDGCTGHFWEGRFQSVPLLDQAAVIAAMVYVDLNPIRAAMAQTPEASDYTSVQDRCVAHQESMPPLHLIAKGKDHPRRLATTGHGQGRRVRKPAVPAHDRSYPVSLGGAVPPGCSLLESENGQNPVH